MSRANPIRRLRRQSLLSLMGAAAGSVAGFGLVIAATRGLDIDEAGAALLALAVFSIASRIGQIGTGTTIVHFMTTRRVTSADRDLPMLLRHALAPVAIVSGALAVAIFTSADILSDLVDSDDPTDLTSALRWTAPFIPVAALTTVLLDSTRGFTEIRPMVIVDRVGRPLVQLLGIVAVVAFGGGPEWLALAWTAASVPALFASAIWLRSIYQSRVTSGRSEAQTSDGIKVDTGKTFWAVALPQTGVDGIRTMVRWQDGILIGILLGASEAAIYVAVTRLVKLASLVNTAFADTIAPHVGEAIGEQDTARAAELYRTSTWWLILLLGPIYLATALHADTFSRVFGNEYTAAATALVILSLGKFAGTIVGSVESVLIVSGNTAVNLGNHLTSLVVNVGLNLLLVPRIGLNGAAIAWVASILLTNYGPYFQLRARTGLSPFSATTFAVIAGVAAAMAAPAAVVAATGPAGLAGTITALVISASLLMAGVRRFRRQLHLDDLRSAPGRGAAPKPSAVASC